MSGLTSSSSGPALAGGRKNPLTGKLTLSDWDLRSESLAQLSLESGEGELDNNYSYMSNGGS